MCPNDCSGHGVCRTLHELDDTYSAWDAHASQQCVCDGGFTGPDCSKRMCPVGADPIEMAQVVDWSVQGIYFRTLTVAESFTNDFNNVVEFVEDKPQVVYYTATFEDEYGDSWTTSMNSVDYLTECQTFDDAGVQRANCIATPDVSSTADVHGFIQGVADSLNTSLAHLPPGAFPGGFVWAAAPELAHKESDGSACDLADTAQQCGTDGYVEQTQLVTYPVDGDAAYVNSLDFRLDTNIVTACDWDSTMDFDGANTDKFGLCLFVKMPAPGVRQPLKVNFWCVCVWADGWMAGYVRACVRACERVHLLCADVRPCGWRGCEPTT